MLSYSPDGQKIVYNRIFRNFRSWKRYDGGLSQELYLYDFSSKQLAEIARSKGPVPIRCGTETPSIFFRIGRQAAERTCGPMI